MASATDYLELALLKHVLKIAAYSSPTTVYLGVGHGEPDEAGSWSGEVSAASYKRQPIKFYEPETSAGVTSVYNQPLRFPMAEENWGFTDVFAVFDSQTGGNLLAWGIGAPGPELVPGQILIAPDRWLQIDLKSGIADGGSSQYLDKKWLDHVFRNQAYSQPSNLYVAMLDVEATYTDTGESLSELAGRVNHNSWSASSQASNSGRIDFAEGVEGTVLGWAICDAENDGNVLFYGNWTAGGVELTADDQGYYPDGGIPIDLD